MLELLITNARLNRAWDAASCTQSVSWETHRTGSPGTSKFTLIKAGDLNFLEGDTVRLSEDGELQFFGWVFTKSKNRWGEIEVTCYDRMRYLKANASYAFYDQTAGDILRQIAGDLQIDVGSVEDTGYRIPAVLEDDQGCLDILESALQQTLLNTGRIYNLYDDGKGLCLRDAEKMISGVVIGQSSYLTDYTYETDIDQQTYNSVHAERILGNASYRKPGDFEIHADQSRGSELPGGGYGTAVRGRGTAVFWMGIHQIQKPVG